MPQNQTNFDYFLEVVKTGEKPSWPYPEEELMIGNQPLDGGLVQYWAYSRESGKKVADLPSAEVLAADHQVERAVILIDQQKGAESNLELILAKDGHALARSLSSLANLEDNLNDLLELARNRFNLRIENFMTTKNVTPEVEKALDELEGGSQAKGGEIMEETEKEEIEETTGKAAPEPVKTERPQDADSLPHQPQEFKDLEEQPIRALHQDRSSGGSLGMGTTFKQFKTKPTDEGESSKKVGWLIVLGAILILGGVLIWFGPQILPKINTLPFLVKPTPTAMPTVVPTATPIPVPVIDRSEYKIRVLNGTSKTGAAASLADTLGELGWEVIKTGNAKNNTIAQTTISIKPDLEEVYQTMLVDLQDELEATQGADLKTTDTVDLEVVIGKK